MYDLHCHVLPSLDDGAGTMEEALKMLEKSALCGVRGVVCTPHSQRYGNKERILPALKALRQAAKDRELPVRLYAGEELLLDEAGLASLERGDVIPINGSRYLLCEFDFEADWEFVRDALGEVTRAGYVPIVAHPERYDFFCADAASAEKIHALGGLLQINRGSVMGRHGEEAGEVVWYLLDTRQADLIASDGHSPYLRTSDLTDVHERISMAFSYDYAERLLTGNPGKILKNEKIL